MPDASSTIPEQASALERVERQLERRPRESAVVRGVDLPTSGGSVDGEAVVATPPSVAAPPRMDTTAHAEQSPLREDIEAALADPALRALYATLAPDAQAAFRTRATQVASAVERAVAQRTFDRVDTLQRITAWLHTLRGIEPHYLEREAHKKASALGILAERAAT